MNLVAPGDLPVIYRSVDLVDMEIVICINISVDLSEVGRFSGLRRSGNWLAYLLSNEWIKRRKVKLYSRNGCKMVKSKAEY